jgi:hypothetical protein
MQFRKKSHQELINEQDSSSFKTYVSKSMSYRVSSNGNLIGFHIFDDAASADFGATPKLPAVANAAAAAAVPV